MLKAVKFAAVLVILLSMPALAEMNGALRIGVLNDMSSVYADFQGPGSVLAAQIAVEDFAKQSKRKIEVISADHQNKPDVGAGIARRWFDVEGVDMIIDLPNSAVALAVSDIAREKNKIAIGSGAGTALLTGAKCSPNFVHWTYDTWANGHALARGVLSAGGKSWFFITADYAFGHDLEKQASDEVVASGGKVLGSVRHPLGVNDLSSFILQSQASNAEVVALANAGGDTVNTVKQAAQFKIAPKQKVVSLIFDLQSVPAIGLETAQGLTALNAWYWDMNDQSRAWSKRYQERHPKKMMPNHMQAGVYARYDALSQGGRKSGLAYRRSRRSCGDEGNANRRPSVWKGNHPRRRPENPPNVSVTSQDAGGVQKRMGCFQNLGDHSSRQGFPSASGWWLPTAQEELSLVAQSRLRGCGAG